MRNVELVERFELDPRKKGRAYSKGNRQKVALVAALASDVELLILDEPTSGLDPLMEEVFRQAARTGTALEVNSFPDRLDLNDEHILWARRHGVKFAVDTDSHSTVHLEFMRFGVGMAQRGWLTKEDVVNCLPLTKIQSALKAKRSG